MEHSGNGLNDFHARWILNGDWIQCRKCKRPQQISWALHDFRHQSGCKNSGAEANPWKTLCSLITSGIADAKCPESDEKIESTEPCRRHPTMPWLTEDDVP